MFAPALLTTQHKIHTRYIDKSVQYIDCLRLYKIQIRKAFSFSRFPPVNCGLAMAFTVPKLPYDYSALEPSIDATTMQIHHGKHHQVGGNAAPESLHLHASPHTSDRMLAFTVFRVTCTAASDVTCQC